MSDLAEFVLARIAEDEAAASPFRNDAGAVRQWRADEIGATVRQIGPTEFGLSDVISESDTHLTAAHIARHDPARVLAECEAKRRIVEERCDQWKDIGYGPLVHAVEYQNRDAVLCLLALPYADHPDYDEEWRP